jgi:acyl-CoA synthetase (NDP forming)
LAALTELLPDFSNPHNPLDVTGYVVVDPRLSFEALQIVAKEAAGNYDMILYATSLPRIAPKDLKPIVRRLDALASARQRIPVPLLLQTSVVSALPSYAQELFQQRGLYLLDGIELGTRAIGHGARYHERRSRYLATRSPASISSAPPLQVPLGAGAVWTEHRARALLEDHGIPVAPAALAKSAAEAAQLASSYAQPVAMKIGSDEVAHKSDVGGVRLQFEPAQTASAFSELVAAQAVHRPGSLLTGVLVGRAGATRSS